MKEQLEKESTRLPKAGIQISLEKVSLQPTEWWRASLGSPEPELTHRIWAKVRRQGNMAWDWQAGSLPVGCWCITLQTRNCSWTGKQETPHQDEGASRLRSQPLGCLLDLPAGMPLKLSGGEHLDSLLVPTYCHSVI